MARGGRVGGQHRIVADLNREWGLLHAGDEVEDWVSRHPILRDCSDLQSVLARIAVEPDEVLRALLVEVRAGSMTAARTVLQAMLGKIVLMANADRVNGIDSYLLAMWECIRRYPVERRPRHVAANLALDARKLARCEPVGSLTVLPWPPGPSFADVVDRQLERDHLDHNHDIAVLTAGDVLRAAVELELIDADAGALLNSVYAEGARAAEVAGQRHISPDAVRQRCSRAVRHLAVHSAAIADCA
ncbi:MAG: hypothetical protein QM650_18560 [Microlunatus sp.]